VVVRLVVVVRKLERQQRPVVDFAGAAVVRGAGPAVPRPLQQTAASPHRFVGWLPDGSEAVVVVAASVLLA